jgi:hypothetical protein
MKMVNWLTRAIITAAIMTSISVATTWVMVNAYVQQLMKEFGQTAVIQPIAFTDVLIALTSGTGRAVRSDGQEQATALTQEQGKLDGEEGTPAVGGDAGVKEYPVPEHALPVMGQAGQAEGPAAASEEELYISMDDLNEKKDSISQEDRLEIFTILITKLPADEVQSISTLLEDGFTADEMKTASVILKQHLTEDEFQNLIGILMKY